MGKRVVVEDLYQTAVATITSYQVLISKCCKVVNTAIELSEMEKFARSGTVYSEV